MIALCAACWQPTPQRIRPEHAHTLEKYTWQACEEDDDGDGGQAGAAGGRHQSYLDPDLFLLLQSVVVSAVLEVVWCHHQLNPQCSLVLVTEVMYS